MTSGLNPFAAVIDGILDDDAERDALVKRCVDELTRAQCVVSVPGICNRLWLGWGADGYENEAACELIDTVVGVAHNEPKRLEGAGTIGSDPARERPGPQKAVALGAIVNANVGFDERFCEIVYKEGAHRALDPTWVPKWLSGAPALPDDKPPSRDYVAEGPRILRERLVVDFSCYGASFAPTQRQWDNLQRRQRYLDAHGHLIVHAQYEPGEDEDDLGYWARWVVEHHPSALEVAGIAPDVVAIRRAAAQLQEAVSSHESIRSFGPYLIDARRYDELVATGPNPGRYDRVARGLAHPYRREQRGWASMSERLCSETAFDMRATAWRDHVVVASLRTLELLADEAPTGDWNGTHLRLDDPWQGGGLWRAEILTTSGPVAADPALALGLGWAEYTGNLDEVPRLPVSALGVAAPDWYADLIDPDADIDEWVEDEVGAWVDEGTADLRSTQVTWTLHVTGADITANRLRLTTRVQPLIRATLAAHGQEKTLVVLDHAGEGEIRQLGAVRPADGHLEFVWPPRLRAGTTLVVSWPLDSLVVRAQSSLLAEPEYIQGVEFAHEYNEQVALAALGLADRPTQALTLSRLVRAAVRKKGDISDDGRRCLSIDEIVAFCFGPAGEVAPSYSRPVFTRAVTEAVSQMVRAGRADREGNLVLVEESTRASGVADQDLLNRYVDSTAQRLRRQAARAWVPPTVVNLSVYRPSAAKRESWPEVAGTDGLPYTDLAAHQTWRRGYLRTGALPADIRRSLARAQAAVADVGASAEHQAALSAAAFDPFGQTAPGAGHPTYSPGDAAQPNDAQSNVARRSETPACDVLDPPAHPRRTAA